MVISAFICGMVLSGCNKATNDNADLSSNEVDLTNAVVKFAEVPPASMPYEVQFVNVSDKGVSYFWDFGDGNTSEEREPTYTFTEPGVYCVTLTVFFYKDDKVLSETFTDRVIVKSLPIVDESSELVANFDVLAVSCKSDNEVMFINKSQNVGAFYWYFGDGCASGESEPVHNFAEAGAYDVTLTVLGRDGESSLSVSKTVVVGKEISVVDKE